MTKCDVAWLSGWLEGEGYFSCDKNTPTIQVTSTDLDVIKKAAVIMDSEMKLRPVKKPREGVKQAYRIALYGKSAVNVMKIIRPFMGSRRGSDIDKALEYYKNTGTRYGRRTGPTPKSSDSMKKRWADPHYREHMRTLKKDWDFSAMGKLGGRKSWKTRKTKVKRNTNGTFTSDINNHILGAN